MFGYETNQKQINKLEKQLATVRKRLEGGLWDTGLEYEVKEIRSEVNSLKKSYGVLTQRVTILEEIARESGLITDFDKDEVKIREDRTFDIYGGINVKQVPYQINKVKVSQ